MTDKTVGETPEPQALSALAADALDDLKATDIQTLDVRDKTSVADYMVIATGTSRRHVKSLAEHVVERVEAQGLRALGTEGTDSCEWVLVDLGDVGGRGHSHACLGRQWIFRLRRAIAWRLPAHAA